MKDRKSKVVVKVLDLSTIEKDIVNTLKKRDDRYTKAVPDQIYGIVETKEGTYILGDEGVGPNYPLTKEKPIEILWYGATEDSYDMLPCAKTTVDIDDIKQCPIKEEKNLASFIRVFGQRLQSNFRQWNSFLEPII
jgi:hypothetical protein